MCLIGGGTMTFKCPDCGFDPAGEVHVYEATVERIKGKQIARMVCENPDCVYMLYRDAGKYAEDLRRLQEAQ